MSSGSGKMGNAMVQALAPSNDGDQQADASLGAKRIRTKPAYKFYDDEEVQRRALAGESQNTCSSKKLAAERSARRGNRRTQACARATTCKRELQRSRWRNLGTTRGNALTPQGRCKIEMLMRIVCPSALGQWARSTLQSPNCPPVSSSPRIASVAPSTTCTSTRT